MKYLLAFLLCSIPAFAACPGTGPASVFSTCHYVSYALGADTNNGTSEATPWKHAPGMKGTGPVGSGTDVCAVNCAGYAPAAGEAVILRGEVFPYTVLPWIGSWNGSSSSTTIGCTGTGCIYWSYDPTWNDGTVKDIYLSRDLGGCGVGGVTVGFSGGGGSGAAATGTMLSPVADYGDGVSYYVSHFVMTNNGSGYTSNPTVSVSGSGCSSVTAVANVLWPVMDAGGDTQTWNTSTNTANGQIQFINSYVRIDGIEFRNYKYSAPTINGNVFAGGGTNFTLNNWALLNSHPSSHPVSGDDQSKLVSANGATGEVSNGYLNDGQPSFLCTGTSSNSNYCSWGGLSGLEGGSVHDNHTTHYVWLFKTPNMGDGTTQYVYNNEAFGGMSSDSGSHLNLFYLGNCGMTVVEYNNVAYDNVGATSQMRQCGNAVNQNKYYIFNNVVWRVGSGNTAWGIDNNSCGADSSCGPLHTVYNFWNNTCGGAHTSSTAAFTASCVNNGAGAGDNPQLYLDINLYNNHAITSQAAAHWFDLVGAANTVNGVSSPTDTTPDSANVIQSLTTANGQGYTIANIFAPINITNATVVFPGTDLTSNCSGGLVPLCTAINGTARPNGSTWNGGAYQFTASSGPSSISGGLVVKAGVVIK